jgi:hypothetical protein
MRRPDGTVVPFPAERIVRINRLAPHPRVWGELGRRLDYSPHLMGLRLVRQD